MNFCKLVDEMSRVISAMKLGEALKIVDEYAAILEESGSQAVLPISMLPHSKEKIKTAMKLECFWMMLEGQWTEERRNALEVCYMCLAHFFDDDKTEKVNSGYRILSNLTKNVTDKNITPEELVKRFNSPEVTAWGEALYLTADEGKVLFEEIKDFTISLGKFLETIKVAGTIAKMVGMNDEERKLASHSLRSEVLFKEIGDFTISLEKFLEAVTPTVKAVKLEENEVLFKKIRDFKIGPLEKFLQDVREKFTRD